MKVKQIALFCTAATLPGSSAMADDAMTDQAFAALMQLEGLRVGMVIR